MNLEKGQRVELKKTVDNVKLFQVELSIFGVDVDFACFGLDKQGKLLNDAYMTFFNQPITPCRGIELQELQVNSATFSCALEKLPSTVERLVFTVTVEDNAESICSMSSGYLKFKVDDSLRLKFVFTASSFQVEKAIMLGEIYRHNGEWRFWARGDGFNDGLPMLVQYFGGNVLDEAVVDNSSTELVQESKNNDLAKASKEDYIKMLESVEKSGRDKIGLLGEFGISSLGAGAAATVASTTLATTFATTTAVTAPVFGSTFLGGLVGAKVAAVTITAVAAPAAAVVAAGAGGLAISYGLIKLIKDGWKNDSTRVEFIKGLQEKIASYDKEVSDSTEQEQKLAKISGIYAILLKLDAITEESVRNMFTGIKNGAINTDFALDNAKYMLGSLVQTNMKNFS